ncbi:protein SCO1 -like protein [Tropilaelaps mercedesae]|uniref:Protein SCO1-like protein n=1 Tax=Tropilaelaps mercedesae TaxID=418985 RepID=A0A1V9X132_9ACAR|nr:protein SCO1 -like protein [Tropilaelaps mercedesae]
MAFFYRLFAHSATTALRAGGRQQPSLSFGLHRSTLQPTYDGRSFVVSRSCTTDMKKTPKTKKFQSPITWRTVTATLGLGGLLTVFMLYTKHEKMQKIEQERKRSLGKAKIGGAFDLVDHNGVPRKSTDFHGKWVILYFGFTHCPDICPDELEKMAKIIDIVDKEHPEMELQPLFITVDPERDTKEVIKAYLSEFHPKILGLTGTVEKLAEATKAFRVYFSAGPRDHEEDYIVDHTVIMYLIGPEGDFIDYYGQTRTAKQIVDGIRLQKLKFDNAKKGGLFGMF